jgi:subtilisin family serine protease
MMTRCLDDYTTIAAGLNIFTRMHPKGVAEVLSILSRKPFVLESNILPFPFSVKTCRNLDFFFTLLGESFAMLSGTSMAAPHVAGLAALIKQKFPSFSPAAIASALSTTTTLSDRQGKPIMAQRTYSNPDSTQSPATAFDMGNGFVNATAALDPGIVFDCSKLYHLSLFWLCYNTIFS